MFKKRITLKILFLLVASDILETCIHLFFKKSTMGQENFFVHDFSTALIFFKAISGSWYLWLGLTCVVAVFIIWSGILSKIDLSVAVPAASFSYILVPLASILFLHEKISLLRWLGISLILSGIILVSLSSKERLVGKK